MRNSIKYCPENIVIKWCPFGVPLDCENSEKPMNCGNGDKNETWYRWFAERRQKYIV